MKRQAVKFLPEDGRSYNCVLAAGRGLQDAEGLSLLFGLAECLQAPIIATRGAVEDGILDLPYMVGMSGKRIRCEIYLGFGVSGSNFHTAGVKGLYCETPLIAAVNPDAKARIHEIADISIYRNCKDTLRELIKTFSDTGKHPEPISTAEIFKVLKLIR